MHSAASLTGVMVIVRVCAAPDELAPTSACSRVSWAPCSKADIGEPLRQLVCATCPARLTTVSVDLIGRPQRQQYTILPPSIRYASPPPPIHGARVRRRMTADSARSSRLR